MDTERTKTASVSKLVKMPRWLRNRIATAAIYDGDSASNWMRTACIEKLEREKKQL